MTRIWKLQIIDHLVEEMMWVEKSRISKDMIYVGTTDDTSHASTTFYSYSTRRCKSSVGILRKKLVITFSVTKDKTSCVCFLHRINFNSHRNVGRSGLLRFNWSRSCRYQRCWLCYSFVRFSTSTSSKSRSNTWQVFIFKFISTVFLKRLSFSDYSIVKMSPVMKVICGCVNLITKNACELLSISVFRKNFTAYEFGIIIDRPKILTEE